MNIFANENEQKKNDSLGSSQLDKRLEYSAGSKTLSSKSKSLPKQDREVETSIDNLLNTLKSSKRQNQMRERNHLPLHQIAEG